MNLKYQSLFNISLELYRIWRFKKNNVLRNYTFLPLDHAEHHLNEGVPGAVWQFLEACFMNQN